MVLVIGNSTNKGFDDATYNGNYWTKEELKELTKKISGVPILIEHNGDPKKDGRGRNIGGIIRKDSLHIVNDLDETTPEGKEAIEGVRSGKYKGFSFGTKQKKVYDFKNYKIDILDKDVYEISLVEDPAFCDAKIHAYQIDDRNIDKELLDNNGDLKKALLSFDFVKSNKPGTKKLNYKLDDDDDKLQNESTLNSQEKKKTKMENQGQAQIQPPQNQQQVPAQNPPQTNPSQTTNQNEANANQKEASDQTIEELKDIWQNMTDLQMTPEQVKIYLKNKIERRKENNSKKKEDYIKELDTIKQVDPESYLKEFDKLKEDVKVIPDEHFHKIEPYLMATMASAKAGRKQGINQSEEALKKERQQMEELKKQNESQRGVKRFAEELHQAINSNSTTNERTISKNPFDFLPSYNGYSSSSSRQKVQANSSPIPSPTIVKQQETTASRNEPSQDQNESKKPKLATGGYVPGPHGTMNNSHIKQEWGGFYEEVFNRMVNGEKRMKVINE